MTEGFGEHIPHNGGGGDGAEQPVAEPERETAAEKRARKRADLAARIEARDGDDSASYRGQWQARNDDGKLAVTSSELAALKFACPPDRVKPYKHGDPIEV